MAKELYRVADMPPLGEVPAKMNAWLIRQDRFGEPTRAFQREVVPVPEIADDECLVYVMAAGVNYNNVWAGLGVPVDVIKTRQKAGEKEDFHIGGSDASGIVYRVGKNVTNVKLGDEVVIHCGTWDQNCPVVKAGIDPMFSPSYRIWGYETNYGSFAQFTRVQAHQCMPKPAHMTWEQAAAYTLVAATAYRMLCGWEQKVEKDDVVLIWGGAGGLGSMAIQIVKARGGIPVAVVSGEDKFDYCKQLGAKGCINRKKFDHWGMLPHWKDAVGYANWVKGARAFGSAIWEVLGERRSPKIVFEHPGESTIPTSMFVCDTGGMVVICAGTSGYNATVDLRYLWMRQKRLQGSHFANDDQSYAMNELALGGQIDPCLSRTFSYEELPLSHQLMHENSHPHGNMAVLVGAPELGLGRNATAPRSSPRLEQPASVKRPRRRAASIPLPSMDTPVTDVRPVRDDGTLVRERMHSGVLSCSPDDTLGDVAKQMVEYDVHGIVVVQADKAVGVVSQTDVVLAAQGRSSSEVRALLVSDVMTRGCVTVEAETKLADAVTEMMRHRIHRVVVTEGGKPTGILSTSDVVRSVLD